jgi:tetratricopeptide (TPR) repeat protein
VRVTATLIVRDEAAHLRRCLASIAPLIDEIVVVDTGSSDDSLRVASDFGARVDVLPWSGDFAAARNRALDHATGTWILYIDADECAGAVDRNELRETLSDPGLVAATVRFRNRTGVTRYHEVRLFRNDPRIRFRNVIHETMMPGVQAVAASDGLRIGRTSLPLDHFGYDGNQDAKHRRNIPLLRERLARDPGHVYSWNHLGQALAGVGDVAGAIAAWQAAIAIVRRTGAMEPLDALPYGSLLVHGGDAVDRTLLEEARSLFPGDRLIQWFEGRELARLERYAEAVAVLAPLAHIDASTFCSEDGIAFDERIFGVPTLSTLGLCHFRLGEYAESEAYYLRAAQVEPANDEHRVKAHLAGARARQRMAAR